MRWFLLILLFPFLVMAAPQTKYGQVWIVPEISTKSFNWEDLGLGRKELFTDPLAQAWEKWLAENLSSLVQKVDVCTAECLAYLTSWEGQNPKDLKEKMDEKYSGGMWLRIWIEVEKLTGQNVDEASFQWEGRAVLVDINTKKTISAEVLWPERKKWSGMDQKTLNSALASMLYRAPMGAFVRFKSILSNTNKIENSATLLVQGHRHLGDVLDLSKALKSRGLNLGLQVHLESFTKGEARLRVFFQGEEKSFTDLLSQLKELKSFRDLKLVIE